MTVGDPVSPLPFIAAPSERLFPYIYVRQWSAFDLQTFAAAFIRYVDISPPDQFIADLVQSKTQGACELLADNFITGIPPYAGQFIANPRNLDSPVACFAAIAERLHALDAGPQEWLAFVEAALIEALVTYDAPCDYYGTPQYFAIIERCWQSYFALAVLNEYSPPLRDELAKILFVAHIVQIAMQTGNDMLVMRALDDAKICELRAAIIILPEFMFERMTQRISSEGSWGVPYAIGDLQLVRQQLKAYVPGEIAHIENVMPGERREVRNRRLRQSLESDQLESLETGSTEIGSDDERDSLQRETQLTLANKTKSKGYDNFTSSYGPPTQATLNGTATRTIAYGSPARSDDVSKFARRILSNSVAKLSRSVRASRATAALSESEQLVSSVIDNSQGQRPIRAVYRWVNKIYEAQVINYGRRVLIEFSINQPARKYIDRLTELSGSSPGTPLSPYDAFDLKSFDGITRDNYAQICGAYNVTDITPPPPAELFVGLTLRGDGEQLLTIPSGYQTVEAKAEFTSCPAGQPVGPVLVGTIQVNDGDRADLPAYGGESAVPVSFAAAVPSLPPCPQGSPPAETVASTFLVNVEVKCQPTIERMNEWKISVYRSVINAYRALADSYFSALDQPGPNQGASLNPQFELQTERNALKQQCVDLMIDCLVDPVDAGDQVLVQPEYRSMYQQFLATALEWQEMSYSFDVAPSSCPDPDVARNAAHIGQVSPFSEFLQASQARVMVPVTPQQLRKLLYFWSTGRIWQGAEWLVPVPQDSVALVVDAERGPAMQAEIEVAKWPLLIPTAMQVLDDGDSGISDFPFVDRMDLSSD